MFFGFTKPTEDDLLALEEAKLVDERSLIEIAEEDLSEEELRQVAAYIGRPHHASIVFLQ